MTLVQKHCTIPSTRARARPRLDNCGVGSGVGVRSGVFCVVPSGVVDVVDDACMDGSVSDVIHAGNSELLRVS